MAFPDDATNHFGVRCDSTNQSRCMLHVQACKQREGPEAVKPAIAVGEIMLDPAEGSHAQDRIRSGASESFCCLARDELAV